MMERLRMGGGGHFDLIWSTVNQQPPDMMMLAEWKTLSLAYESVILTKMKYDYDRCYNDNII